MSVALRATGLDPAAARSLPRHRLALIAGAVGFVGLLVMNVPGVADVRQYRSLAAIFSHLTMTLIAFGLSPRFPRWIAHAAALSSRQRVLALTAALAGPLAVIVAGLVLLPSYGHELFTREWGIVEPLHFVGWMTAAWLALTRARCSERGSPDDRVFRLGAGACVLLALEEVDYLGVVSLIARASGVPNGRILGHHIGGLHDVINDAGKASLMLGALLLVALAGLVLAWCVSRGLHRVLIREALSSTSLPLVGTVVFLALAQLSDIDHPYLDALLGHAALVRRLSEEPMELLAVVCANASLLAKLAPWVRA